MQHNLKGAFISGAGIFSEQLVVEIVNNDLGTTYRIWIDAPIECTYGAPFYEMGLQEEEVDLLALNRLRYLVIEEVRLHENEDLELVFAQNIRLKIWGFNPDKKCLEPWRLYQVDPDPRVIRVVSNK